MIGSDEVDDSIAEAIPKAFAIFACANRGSAFEESGALRDCFRDEMQIVRTGFDGNGKTCEARGLEVRNGSARGEMDDVQAEFEFAAEREEKTNGGEFGFLWARLQIGLVMRPVRAGEIRSGEIDGSGKFCVYEKREACASDMREGGAQLLLGDHCEAVNAGMNEKTFEARDARGREQFDVEGIIGDDTAPRQPIDVTSATRRGALGFESGDVGGGGEAIEGHVDEERVATGGGGARSGLEPFPVRAPGVVDVNVGIDEAGENDGIAEIVRIGVGRDLVGRHDAENAAVFHEESGGADALRRYDTAGEEGAHGHGRR